mgnify:FL=1
MGSEMCIRDRLHPEQPADSSDDAEETITDAVEDPEKFVDAA